MSSASPGERVPDETEAVLASLDLKLPAQRLPVRYFLSLAAVLIAWVVLVAVYVCLVVTFAAIAVAGAYAVPEARGFWGLAFALGVVAFGATVTLFLLKPVFAPRGEEGEHWAIQEADEPLLFAYVARLARLEGARAPDRIVVDTHVNASAGHLNLLGLRRGRLQLTLGLPLVASLNLRELTGVLAHELGHFRQGFGARVALIVRALNGWFHRAALERDAWDASLEEFVEDESTAPLVRLPFTLAALGIALSRRLLFLELHVGAVLSCFWSRQMEYDADRREAALSGGAAFAETALKLRVLEVSSARAHEDLAVAFREGRLADDLPALIAAHAAAMPRETVSRIRNGMLARRTRLTDSHPSDLDRIERARAFGPGLLRTDAPASALFSNLPRLCRSASLDYYRRELGLDVGGKNLAPTGRLVGGAAGADTGGGTVARFFQGVTSGAGLFFLEYESVPQLPENARHHMARLRARFLELAPGGRAARRELDRAYDLRMRVAAASRLVAAGVPFRPTDFGLPSATEDGLAKARERADALEGCVRGPLDEMEKVLRQRVLLALALMRDRDIAAAVGGEERLRRASSLVVALASLQRLKPEFRDLDVDLTALEPILAVIRSSEAHAGTLTDGALELLNDVERVLQTMRWKLAQAPCPWEHVDGDLTMARYLVPEVPPAGEWLRLREMGHEVRQRYLDAHARLLAEIAGAAELVEEAVGLARLSESARQDRSVPTDSASFGVSTS